MKTVKPRDANHFLLNEGQQEKGTVCKKTQSLISQTVGQDTPRGQRISILESISLVEYETSAGWANKRKYFLQK